MGTPFTWHVNASASYSQSTPASQSILLKKSSQVLSRHTCLLKSHVHLRFWKQPVSLVTVAHGPPVVEEAEVVVATLGVVTEDPGALVDADRVVAIVGVVGELALVDMAEVGVVVLMVVANFPILYAQHFDLVAMIA